MPTPPSNRRNDALRFRPLRSRFPPAKTPRMLRRSPRRCGQSSGSQTSNKKTCSGSQGLITLAGTKIASHRALRSRKRCSPTGRKILIPCGSTAVTRTAGTGASHLLPRAQTMVTFLISEQSLGVGCGNCRICPILDLARRRTKPPGWWKAAIPRGALIAPRVVTLSVRV